MKIWLQGGSEHMRFLSQIALTALKYETPMFQEFRTQNWLLDNSFIWVYEYSLILKINFFPKALLAASVSCHMQRFNLKNSISICHYSIFLTAYTHFQNFTSFFKSLHTNPRIAHKMPRISCKMKHCIQNILNTSQKQIFANTFAASVGESYF